MAKMRKKKHLRGKSIYSPTSIWFTITPEMIARMDNYLKNSRNVFRQRLILSNEIEGGVLAGPTK